MKKFTPAAVFVLTALLFIVFPFNVLAAGSQSITRTFAPTANAAVTVNAGDNNGFEITPQNAYVDDNTNYAVDTNSGNGDNTVATGTGADKHHYYNFGMGEIPDGSTISGITVRADIAVDATAHSPYTAIRLSWDGGTSWTAVKQQTLTAIAQTTYNYGGTTDTWGHTPWSVSELSDANFIVRVINGDVHATQNQRDFSLEYIAVSITFTAPWDSYGDTARNTVIDTFTGGYGTAYMKGTGFLDGAQTYNVSYYDGGGTKITTDAGIALANVVSGRGELGNTSSPYEPMYTFIANPTAKAGTWHAVVQPSGATTFPSLYSTLSAAPDNYKLIANDEFTVNQDVIPEFPTVFGAIAVTGLCFGIYWWMRKRAKLRAG